MSTAKKIKSIKRPDQSYLTQVGGTGDGRVFELSRAVLSIGRTEENEIIMKSESVSRCHAYLRRSSDGEWLFQDNNSKNGIRVNGKKVSEAVLKSGDTLSVGDFTFKFEAAEIPNPPEKTTPSFNLEAPPPAQKVPPSATSTDVTLLLKSIVKALDRHSWLMGLVVGLIVGAAVWWKASGHQSRPGEVVSQPLRKVAPIETAPPPVIDAKQEPPASKPKSDIRDLKVYLSEGRAYLKEGDKESAAIAFRFALVLDPNNKEARNGLRAAGAKAEPLEKVEPKAEAKADAKPATVKEEPRAHTEAKSRLRVSDLLKAAVDAYGRRSFQEAIDKAEAARKIEIRGQTEYLNEAKQIIDRAKQKQKEDFQPFLESALQKLSERNYKASAALCEEMLRTDPAYAPARECLAKSLDGMAGKRRP